LTHREKPVTNFAFSKRNSYRYNPGASNAQYETMLAMSKSAGEADWSSSKSKSKGPTSEQIKEAENAFNNSYDPGKKGSIDEVGAVRKLKCMPGLSGLYLG
jgi:hypothetical protein